MTQMRDRIALIAEQVRTQMDLTVLESGWFLFRRFAIVSLQPEENSFIKAEVRDKQAYEVLLHTETLSLSKCSCDSGPLCRHLAAAFFQAYNMYGYHSATFLASCRQYQQWLLEEKPQIAAAPAAPEMMANTNTTLFRTPKKIIDSAALPLPIHTPGEWHAFFAANFDFKEDVIDTSIVHTAQAYYEYANSDTWEPTVRLLYQLHVQLFLLQAIDRNMHGQASDWSFVRIQWKMEDQYMAALQEIEQLLEQLSPEEAYHSYPQAVASIKQYVIDSEANIERSSIDWTSIYQLLWEQLLRQADWQEVEYTRIEASLRYATPESKTWRYLQRIAAWQEVLQGLDAAAIDRLKSVGTQDKLVYYWRIMYYHADRNQWSALLRWIHFVMPAMERASRNDWAVFMRAWGQGAEHQPDAKVWHQVMVSYLHLTYWYYCDYLMKKGLYRTWVDIHLYRGISPREINKDMLRQLEQQDRELLLPLYHQSVERAIAGRNREAYRDAVRLMKKLKQIYKTLNRVPVWERYIQYISHQHSRLRALQEEIKKGKLL
ncbi:SWIM zinc finger family protein [Paenibacillus marinisediminis]